MTFGRIIYMNVNHDCKRRELLINQRLKLKKNVVCIAKTKQGCNSRAFSPFCDTCK